MFHEGELTVQRRAGVEADAARLEGMLAPADLRGGLAQFLAGRTYAALAARDGDDRLWVAPVSGPPGFLEPTGATTLAVHAAPAPGDALHGLPADQPVGLIVLEYVARRRARVNGRLVAAGPDGLLVEVAEAFGNCPRHIPPRPLALAAPADGSVLDDDLVAAVDTFVLGTSHPERGADASHRGGPPGFLRRESAHVLVWDDLPGNQMFTSLGNLAVDPAAALLLVHPGTGRRQQLSGTASVRWDVPGSATGRQVAFEVERVVG
ncbi:pyridoxamine 5'-phosphate oxidase family protein [Nocardioides anomalus]|uniref:pyridoxamine 5'-phosphate oxidase family protein n=1 Tax=Nocardioides anomalus TaxID=2712223 RepID=UPI001E5DB62A|nr:pyridoxamine 5'-phosphate oxidase family protein [Nocardioides anomalus]